jgi:hypothetical protein
MTTEKEVLTPRQARIRARVDWALSLESNPPRDNVEAYARFEQFEPVAHETPAS